MRILHCFASERVESEALEAYGTVYAIGDEARPHQENSAQAIKANAKQLPIRDGVTFDLGLFHPPCPKWAAGTHINGDRDDHPNLIPLAREIADEYCDEYIIENVPKAPLNDPVKLNGGMFGSPLHYERAFETSYHVPQPFNQSRLDAHLDSFAKHHDKGDWNGPVEIWKSAKGYSGDYNARSLKREAIPRAYIDYLIRPLL